MKTTTRIDDSVQLPAAAVTSAARALSAAGRWAEAIALVDGADPVAALTRASFALLAGEIAVERDYVTSSSVADARISAAERTFEATPGIGSGLRWDLAFLRLRQLYAEQIQRPGGEARLGPEGRDVTEVDRIRERASVLREEAPDGLRRGWADMCLGWIADNLFGERDIAPGHYEAALAAGESGGDELLVREALRHLGDHDHDRADHASALERWQRATAAGARAGTVAGTLSQQILLAVLARDAGDEAGAVMLAGEIARWADAIGAVGIHGQAAAFLRGVDPTAPPGPDQAESRETKLKVNTGEGAP